MSILNLPSINLSPDVAARVLGLMLVAWQPFISGARLPSLLLFLRGVWMLWRKRINFQALAVKRMGLVFLLLLIPVLLSLPASLAVIAFPLQSQPVLYTLWWFPIVLCSCAPCWRHWATTIPPCTAGESEKFAIIDSAL